MMPSIRRRRAMLDEKLVYWISHRINVLFRCGFGVGIASEVKSAFDNSGLRWRAMSASSGTFEQILGDASVGAVWIDGLDRAPKKFQKVVLDSLGERPTAKMVWATVTLLDEDDFDLESADPLHAENFDIVVDVPAQRSRPL